MNKDSKNTNAPSISLPTGGGAIQGIGETFSPNLFSGTGNFTIPIFASPGREGFGPQLSLNYSTGNGNGIFGLGWQLAIPRITRKTEKGLPLYDTNDVFVISGAEDLVPKLKNNNQEKDIKIVASGNQHSLAKYRVARFIPRTEGLFAQIESWERLELKDSLEDKDPTHLNPLFYSNHLVINHFWRVTTKENVTSIYGRTPNSRITPIDDKPYKSTKVYEWLLEETFDSKGNHIYYEYVGDEPQGNALESYEENRSYYNRYPRRILYGNLPSQLQDYSNSAFTAGINATATSHLNPFKTLNRRYAYELLFDYEDLQQTTNNSEPFIYPPHQNKLEKLALDKFVRPDPFSSFRPGFELRTMRRCSRVLMLHHFKELNATATKPILVKSTDFEYQQASEAHLSLLTNTTITGYKKKPNNSYSVSSMPPLEFGYSDFRPQEQSYQSVNANQGNVPSVSLNDVNTTLVDIFGNGLQDLVQSNDGGFQYWRNLGGGSFDSPHKLHNSPSGLQLQDKGVYFADTGGDGLTDLVVNNEVTSGFFELEAEKVVNKQLQGGWSKDSFTRVSQPSIDPNNPNLKRLDLTGDGLTDLLLSTDTEFIWFQGKGEEGFSDPKHVAKKHGLEDIFFADQSGRVRLADMTGDGLSDIVLLHNGRIDYWPNLGYGNFGKRFTMNSKEFRLPLNFDPKRLFLVDIDGSGPTDIVYVGFNETHFWFNQSGNSLSKKQTISGTPITVDNTSVSFADLYGTGTACLIWSYDFGTLKDGNYKALDFCGQQKPYLLNSMANNLGATTKVQYASSTKFYLQDVADKTFWATPLPFPVQVVEKTESIDAISNTKLVSSFKYHHGFYDGKEREFRGFGRVDQIDTEFFDEFSQSNREDNSPPSNADRAHHSAPVETRTWFHTGAYYENDDILERYRAEYFSGVDKLTVVERPRDPAAFDLGTNEIPDDDSSVLGEAYRALRGSVIRTEVYAHDNSSQRNFPYLVSENTYQVKTVQPKSSSIPANKRAVFITTAKDQISYHYERARNGRNLVDPRIQHSVILKTDKHGNVLEAANIAYKRRQSQYAEQSVDLISISHNSYCEAIDELADFRHSVSHQSEQYELTGMVRSLNQHYTVAILTAALASAQNIRYEQKPTSGQLQKRLLSRNNALFWKDDLSGPADLGQSGIRALAYESYALALTPTLRTHLFGAGKVKQSMGFEGGYRSKVNSQWLTPNQGNWWIPSGQQRFSAQNFYQAEKTIDPFGAEVSIQYDPYQLFPVRIEDPLNNIQEGLIDYRVLQPNLTRDINGNHAEAAFDVLGMLVGTAVMGKAGRAPSASILGIDQTQIDQMRANSEADSLHGFDTDISANAQHKIFTDPDGANNSPYPPYPANIARNALKRATSRIIYDIFAYQLRGDATRTCTIAREEHHKTNASSPVQISYSYSDGFGRSIQQKAQAEALKTGPDKDKRRWVVSGWTVFNNKGSVVKQFEPRFSFKTNYEPGVETGVSTVSFYDPLQRLVCKLNPNHSYEKVVFTPWQQKSWDTNDTVLLEPQNDTDIMAYVRDYISTLTNFETWYQRLMPAIGNPPSPLSLEQQAAIKAAAHADTPNISHINPLGTIFLTEADNQTQILQTWLETDIEGNDISITDARNVKVFEHKFDMAGRKLYINSKDAGEKKLFPSINGSSHYSWDANGNEIHTAYDVLRRAINVELKKPGQSSILVDKFIYGENRSQAEATNSRGGLWKHYDSAGLATIDSKDFKGNVLQASRRLLIDAKQVVADWPKDSAGNFDETAALALLETNTRLGSPSYTIATTFDALNRLVENILPNGAIQTPGYNDASLLEGVSMQNPGQAAENYVTNIDYNAKGQRKKIEYGNGVTTDYEYEPETFRLKGILTKRNASPKTLQKLSYHYDPVGNITSIRDDAHRIIFNHNQSVEPESKYTYDALYRLVEANGREHESMTDCHYQTNGKKHTEFLPLPQSANSQALINYIEAYQYDQAGNLTRTEHKSQLSTGSRTRIRNQSYANQSNRIIKSNAGCANEDKNLIHDANGNLIKLAHLPEMKWDHKNQLIEVQLNVGTNPNRAYYQYDGSGQRIRKTVVRNGGADISERIYLGDYEIYTETTNSGPQKRRESVHISDDQARIAIVETETDLQNTANAPNPLKRFQLNNHLGSAVQELDETGQRISYEEYYPYGGSAYMAGRNQAEVSLKRYRYSGKERDDETGLYYYGARYYAPWLERWVSCDPIGKEGGVNLFIFASNSPEVFIDEVGFSPEKTQDTQKSIEVDESVTEQSIEVNAGPGAKSNLSGNQSVVMAIIIGALSGVAAGGTPGEDRPPNAEAKEHFTGAKKAADELEKGPPKPVKPPSPPEQPKPSRKKPVPKKTPTSMTPYKQKPAAKFKAKKQTGRFVAKSAGNVLTVASVVSDSLTVGEGVNKIIDGETGQGVVDVVEGTAKIGITVMETAAVGSSAVVAISGAVATASIGLAAETTRASLSGEKTPAVTAREKYAQWAHKAENEDAGFFTIALIAAGGTVSEVMSIGQ